MSTDDRRNGRDGKRPPLLLMVEEAAEFLRVSQKTVRRMIADGRLPHFRVGRSIRVAESDLRALRRRGRK